MAFAYDANNYVMNNACYIMTGDHLDYLLAVLNSQAITWYSYVTNMNKIWRWRCSSWRSKYSDFPYTFLMMPINRTH